MMWNRRGYLEKYNEKKESTQKIFRAVEQQVGSAFS
jgi:hypothetical protein